MKNHRPISGFHPLKSLLSLTLILLLAAVTSSLAQPSGGASTPSRAEQLAPADLPARILPNIMAEAVAALQGKIKPLTARLTESQQRLSQAQTDLRNFQVTVATIRAALAVGKPSLSQIESLLAAYSAIEAQTQERIKALTEESNALKQEMTADTVAQNTLRNQVETLKASGEPTVSSPEFQQNLSTYLQLADTQYRLAAQVLDNLDKTRQTMKQERLIVASLQPDLKKVAESWKTELLQRPPARMSLHKQLARLWEGLSALPGQAWQWLTALVSSGELRDFFVDHLARLVGLAVFLALLAWSTRRLQRLATRRFKDWRGRATDLDLLPLYILGLTLVASLFRLGLIFWVGIIFWDFNALGSSLANLVLALLVAWWGLRLALDLVQAWFAGEAAGGVLPLDAATARFYRRSLKVFAAYLFLSLFALRIAPLLNFPESSRLFAEHVFLLGLLVWGLWLLRRPHLGRLQPALPDPRWVRRQAVARVFKGIIIFFLAVAILADLLSLSNLAVYVAQAAVWSGLAIFLFWFLWLAGETVIYHLLHPDLGWAQRRYPARQELLQRVYRLCRLVLSVNLGAAVIFWSLSSWGIPPERVAWAFRWVTWGPTLGPVKLTILSVAAASLTLYLGFWLSRLLRGLMDFRIFPRIGFDAGVQYTVSTTVHYVVLLLAALVALSLLGFPLTNLALLAGALGVGIGFGLQNIVNNFISGLILLFERPIKVGDLLVIDNQWGTVKEIRVRSTLFETSDRSVLIIPNSELISGKVLNWTHYGRGVNRITLKVGVGYDSDVRRVTQLLTDICRANDRVVDHPKPQIYFSAYGDSTLDFTIWVHVKTPDDRVPATHEINSAILETFQQQGIEIPFPQRDLHIKDRPAPPAE
ncbi:MAG: mechanosensitive ion channel [Deltaproteobacteria bacterium]|nr:mechanosensitive ion channel [Deltaproteobacteria bacterium]